MTPTIPYYAVTESGHAFYVGRFASEDDALDTAIQEVYKRNYESRVTVYTRAAILRLIIELSTTLTDATLTLGETLR